MTQRIRDDAAHLLALCASGNGETLLEIAAAVGRDEWQAPIRLARLALAVSLCGNWRETRAEAEAKLRSGWSPRG